MKSATLALIVALASGSEDASLGFNDAVPDDEHLSLLQLRAAPQQNQTFRSGRSGVRYGCRGQVAVDTMKCGYWGDVHQQELYRGGSGPDFNGMGWYWIAKSKDGSFQAQAFIRQGDPPAAWSTVSHHAYKFGDKIVFVDRDNNVGRGWLFTHYINGEKVVRPNMDLDPFYMRSSDQNACIDYPGVAVELSYSRWMGANLGPYAEWTRMDLEIERSLADENFGQCAGHTVKVDPGDILVTKEQNDKICRENKMTDAQCTDPAPPAPPLTKEELCEQNGIAMQHAEDLCADQQAHGNGIYEGCLYDVCASDGPEAEENAAAGAEEEAQFVNPEAKCVVASDNCDPCDICAAAVTVDLTNVVQNNLGGAGPDGGAEEIRYKNAMDLNGKKVDVVLTAQGEYITPKPEKNGVTGDGFGRFLMKLKASTDFQFQFQDADTGEPVAVKDVALSFYDMDEAKDDRQRETVTVCGAKEAYVTANTELDHKATGVCHSFSSTVKGTGKDNPKEIDAITRTQAARTVTYEFHSRASITFSAALSRSGRNTRPFLFAFSPAVACGASDQDNRCAA